MASSLASSFSREYKREMGGREISETAALRARAERRPKITTKNLNLKPIDEIQAISDGTVLRRRTVPTKKLKSYDITCIDENTMCNVEPNEDLSSVDIREFYAKILMDGYVESYIDAFKLLHRPEAAQISMRDAEFIVAQLIFAEDGRKNRNLKNVYDGYNALAEYYQLVNDSKTCITFYGKCLKVSKEAGNKEQEMVANRNIGLILNSAGDIWNALKYLECYQKLVTSLNTEDEKMACASELTVVYQRCAEEKEIDSDYSTAIELWSKLLEFAKFTCDKQREADSYYRLGLAYSRINHPDEALQFFTMFNNIAIELSDHKTKLKAFAALGNYYLKLGNREKALEYFSQQLQLACAVNDAENQYKANGIIGALFLELGNYSRATSYLKHQFLLATSNEEQRLESCKDDELDMSRCIVGFAQGKDSIDTYMTKVNGDINSLLNWKLNRVNIP